MTDAELILLFNSLYPDNNERLISEGDAREGFTALLQTLSARLGNLDDLTTPIAVSIVAAINSIQSQVNGFNAISFHYGPNNPNITPPEDEFDLGAYYIQQHNNGETIQNIAMWIYTGVIGIGWLDLTDTRKFINTPIWEDAEPGEVYNFPPCKRGQSYAFRVIDTNTNEYLPNESFWLGGFSGISAGHMTVIIAMQDTPGGNFNEVGKNFLIINQKKETLVVTGEVMPDDFPNPGKTGTIYIETSTGLTYYWYQLEGELVAEYVPIGEVIRGKLISATLFNDEDNVPVVPTGIQLYFDIHTDLYYRWDGAQFVPINYTTGEGGSIDLSHLLEGNVPRYDPLTGNLENSVVTERAEKVGIGTAEPTEKLVVVGNAKANKLITTQQASNAIPNTFWTNSAGNPMHTNGAGVSKQLQAGSNVFVYTPTGNFTISAIKTAMETAGLIFNDSHIIINLGTNNYTCSIDLAAANFIFTIGRRGTGSISFSSTRTLNSGPDAITILNGNESSMALIDCGTTTDFLKIRNY